MRVRLGAALVATKVVKDVAVEAARVLAELEFAIKHEPNSRFRNVRCGGAEGQPAYAVVRSGAKEDPLSLRQAAGALLAVHWRQIARIAPRFVEAVNTKRIAVNCPVKVPRAQIRACVMLFKDIDAGRKGARARVPEHAFVLVSVPYARSLRTCLLCLQACEELVALCVTLHVHPRSHKP